MEKKNLNYWMDQFWYQIFKTVLSILSKSQKTVNDNAPVRIYVNKTENRITLRNNTGYYPKPLTPKTMKLLWST